MEGQTDIAKQLEDLFDNPTPGAPLQEPAAVVDAWDADDDQFVDDFVARASAPGEALDPSEIVGDKAWRQEVAADPVGGGIAAADRIRASWDWDMTPGQRARALADVAFGARIGSLIDGFTKSATRTYPDPFDYAAEVAARRRA